MNLNNFSNKLDQLGQAWEGFKQTNEERLANLEKKQNDPLLDEKLAKMNKSIDGLSVKSASTARPTVSNNTKGNTFSVQYKKAFNDYVRKGIETGIAQLSDSSKVENGYEIAGDAATAIEDFLNQNSTLRQLTNPIKISNHSFDAVKMNAKTLGAWGDGSTVAPVSNNFEKHIIKTYDLTAQPKVTQRLLDDSEIDLEYFIANRVGEIFITHENEAFIKGDGVNKPNGILNNQDIARIKSGSATGITVDGLMSLYYSLDDIYMNDAAFLMSREAVHKIRTLKDSNGNYLWSPSLLASKSDTLLGLPLYTNESVESVAATNDAVIFGSFKQGYQIVDRGAVSIQRDPYTAKPFVVFFITKRTGGDVVNSDAFKIMNIGL